MTQNIFIEVGESPEALLGHYGKAIDLNDKNPGSRFYSVDWERPQLGVVTLKNGDGQVAFDLALGVMGSYNEDYPQEGLSRYSLYLGLSEAGTMSHDHARLKFYEMLARIQKAGWQRYLDHEEPRLQGAESVRRLLQTGISMTTLDPGYVPTFEVWMMLKDRSSWQFYKDGVYMDVWMSRDSKRMDPNLPGAYFVSISLESYANKWRTLFDEADRPRWRELLLEEKAKASAERAKTEQQLQAEGYHIDTGYRNPDAELDLRTKPGAATNDKPVSPGLVSTPQPPPSLKDKLGRWIKGQ